MKTWKWLRVEVVACGFSWSELERAWNLQGWSTKKPHSLGVPFFGLVYSRGVAHFYRITLAMNSDFSRISNTNLETSVEYLQRHFLKPPSCFFFLKQTIDKHTDLLFWVLRYPSHCTDIELLPELPPWKICYRLHPKIYLFLLFPNNLLLCNLKVFILTK